MGMERRLHLRDMWRVYDLVGQCREVGNNSERWHRRALEGICPLIGAASAIGGEGIWPPSSPAPIPMQLIEVGYSPRASTIFARYAAGGGLTRDLFLTGMPRAVGGNPITRLRRQVVADDVWLTCEAHSVRTQAGIGDEIKSIFRMTSMPDPHVDVITVQRATGDPPFGRRERRIVRAFHHEIGRLIGSVLKPLGAGAIVLPPRQHQVLSALLQGDSEKEAAGRLGIKVATVHQYVTALYRRFGVCSRAELLAKCLANRAESMALLPADLPSFTNNGELPS